MSAGRVPHLQALQGRAFVRRRGRLRAIPSHMRGGLRPSIWQHARKPGKKGHHVRAAAGKSAGAPVLASPEPRTRVRRGRAEPGAFPPRPRIGNGGNRGRGRGGRRGRSHGGGYVLVARLGTRVQPVGPSSLAAGILRVQRAAITMLCRAACR